MPFYSMGFVFALACAAFFWHAGEKEMGSGVPWTGLSVLVSGVILMAGGGGVLAVLLGQAGLLVGITLFRLWRDPH
ncbi:hypothetical protein [Pseudomarimonas salicorniae]|uniref:Uncharacterized protein n=1 Tax=Pseudomarimonas salicorniae TaxID=2933270 RepID=A0ABT0GCY2_9GAMM|nr:hypothetical protein [Lysobacter sp. CAU 1642]MCK7592401.1 hypothetical protein [Lysobacter sp. CAU 1642]